MKTKNRLSFKVLLIILLSFVLLTTVSYAWFYTEVNLGGNTIETDALEYEAYGYDANGALVSTLLNENNSSAASNINSPLFSSGSFAPGNSSTVYVSIKSNASIDLEYNLSIIARGYGSGEVNFTELGGYWYRITDITSKVTTLAAYVSSYKNTVESGSQLNMKTINTSSTLGVIKTSDTSKIKYYRIDFGVSSTATDKQYTTNRIELFANVEVDQVGNTNNNQSVGREFMISDSTTLINAIETANSSDTLYFLNNVEYTGDLIIKKCLNMNLGGKMLTVTGNVIYNFQTANNLKINLAGNGTLKILSSNGYDGNLILDAPNAQIEIVGSNKTGGLIVEKDIIISCSNEDNKMGCVFSNVSTCKTSGDYATIILKSNTTITISDVTKIDTVSSYDDSMNIKIINNGIINNIDLSSMKVSTQTASPQIYIHNYNEITAITLPSWSTKFLLGSNGTNAGNTRISNSFGANISSIAGSNTFTSSDILKVSSTIFVESVDGTNTNLRVLFKDKADGTVTTIQGLLDDYFKNLGYTSSQLTTCYKGITRLEIDSVEGKNFASSDLSFLNGTKLSGLKVLDLADALFNNNTLPSSFYNQSNLTELILPRSLTRIEADAFGSNIKFKFLNIPKSVISLGTNALSNVRYAIFESNFPPTLDTKNKVGTLFNFVPQDSIETYEAAFNSSLPVELYHSFNMAVYPYATLADDNIHFVRRLDDGTYEIVTADIAANSSLIVNNNNKYVIGKNIKIDGTLLTISSVGRCAYLNQNYGNFIVTFEESVNTIEYKSFDYARFNSIDFCNVQNFAEKCCRNIRIINTIKFSNSEIINGEHAFAYCYADLVDTGTVKELSSRTFSHANLYKLYCPNLITIGYGSIYRCNNMTELYTPKVEFIKTTGISENAVITEINLPSVREIGYWGMRKNSYLVSLRIGANFSYASQDIIGYCSELQYLFLEQSAYVKIDNLESNTNGSENRIVKNIYVSESAYNGYYSNMLSGNKTNLLDFGYYKIGSFTYNIIRDTVIKKTYNVGEYIVKVENKGVTIVSYNVDAAEIPNSYQIPATMIVNNVEMPVIGIGRNAFKGKAVNPTSFNNVEKIGANAFDNCDYLINIDAPKLISADESAFANCNKLTTANIPLLKHWSANLFANCPKLTKIVSGCKFTSDTTSISGTTKAVTNITIDYVVDSSDSLPATTVFDGLKSKCANVALYVKAESLSTFNSNTVFKTFTLNTIEVNVSDVNGNIYYLTNYTINNNNYYQIDYIKSNGTSMIIPESYNNINVVCGKEGAYDGITASTITIPRYYIYIKDGEFSNVIGLTSFIVNANNSNLITVDGVLYSKDKTELICYPVSKGLTSYTIDAETKVVKNSAFKNVTGLTTVTFQSNIGFIGVDAFTGSSATTFIFNSASAPYLMGSTIFGENISSIIVPTGLSTVYSNNFRIYSRYIQEQ